MNTRQRLGNMIWPLILILVGAVFLLYNLGYFETGFWQVLVSLWPLLVAAFALHMALVGGAIFLPLGLVAFAAGFLLRNLGVIDANMWLLLGQLWPLLLVALGLDVLISPRLWGQNLTTSEFEQPIEGATSAYVKIDPGAGEFNLDASARSDVLLTGSSKMGTGQRMRRSLRMQNGEARITIRQPEQPYFFFSAPWTGQRAWKLSLNPTLPTQLKINGGMGRRILDLHDLTLTRVKVDGGLGTTLITLPSHGQVKVDVDGGMGDYTLRIPAAMPARIKIDSGLGTRQVHGNFQQQGDIYQTPGYETAADHLEIDVDQGLGSLTIMQM